MPPKPKGAIAPAVPRTHGAQPRCMQTSGIFRLPAELIVEILDYFGDPHHNIRSTKEALGTSTVLDPDDVERLTVIRILTMTCWHLRNMLFPLLWRNVEGCNVSYRRAHRGIAWGRNGLYDQCAYLVLNPTVGAYVQTLSVDLQFRNAPKDLMTKFVDCLVRLPNLRTLEVFGASHVGPITKGLKRKCARFPSVRELWISDKIVKFFGSCPNVESLITQDGLSWESIGILSSHRKELGHLKRVIGVNEYYVRQVVQFYPDLQEIGIQARFGFSGVPATEVEASGVAGHLRSLKHLAVVELAFPIQMVLLAGVRLESRRDKIMADLKVWKVHLVQVLKESPSKERKFLRWKVSGSRLCRSLPGDAIAAVGNGELEVLPGTSL